MLPAGAHVLYVWDELLGLVDPGTLLIDSSTIDVDSARKAHALADKAGCLSLDAPVSGGTGGAAAGTLTFMVGGADDAFTRGKPLLDAMGKKIVHCGDVRCGPGGKDLQQHDPRHFHGRRLRGLCARPSSLGLSHQALFDVASTSSGQCWSLTTYCPVPGPVPTSPANNDYKPGFAASLMLKDLKLSQQAASTSGASTPMGAQAAQLYSMFEKLGHGGEDFSALIHLLRGNEEAKPG